jgi:rhamnogalacturonyl hydrolase YesR
MTQWSTQLADTLLTRYPNPDSLPFKPWCYAQGYVLVGFEKLWRRTHDPRYLAYLRTYGDQHVTADGSIKDFLGDSLDDMMAGTVLVALSEITGEEKYRLAAQRVREAFAGHPRNADGGFWHGKNLPHEMWIDGVFMGQMFLTRYGASIGETDACFDEAAAQILIFAARCRKGQTGLFYHAWDESHSVSWADPVTGLSPEVWSEGLGWYALILVETLALMPGDHPRRAAVLAVLVELLDGLCRTQDPGNGLWFQVVDKGDWADNWHDSSGSAMFIYSLARAAELGYTQSAGWLDAAKKGYQGLISKATLDAAGLVDIRDACAGVCVQNSYADYIHYPRVVNAQEAVGGFLWAAGIMDTIE